MTTVELLHALDTAYKAGAIKSVHVIIAPADCCVWDPRRPIKKDILIHNHEVLHVVSELP